jgi:hypothetical protein
MSPRCTLFRIGNFFPFILLYTVTPLALFSNLCAVALTLVGATAFLRAQSATKHTQSISTDTDYAKELQSWRKERESKLRADNGWLSVAGLLWLKQGENWLGSLPSNNVRLPEKAPATLGSLRLDGDSAAPRFRFFPVTNLPVTITRGNGTPVNPLLDSSQTLAFDNDNGSKPDIISIGDLSMFVVRRTDRSGTRFAIRLRDKNSEARKNFKGCSWFPAKPEYRVKARFTAYDSPRTVEIENILGGQEKHTAAGYVEFRLGNKEYKLEAEQEGDKLFFNFRDETSGKATYPAGRFLYSDLPQNGVVTLDFNKAENPPCAFTNFATCPLPPRMNWLKARIEAGEKTHHPHE